MRGDVVKIGEADVHADRDVMRAACGLANT
jgi:hypothetical protein